MRSRSILPLLSLLILVASADYSPLYVLSSVYFIGNLTEYPVELLEIDLNTNTSTSLLQWTSPKAFNVDGSAYDATNLIYYFVQDSKLTAIDVANNQFLYQDYDFADGARVVWDISLDSEGNIHYLSQSGTEVQSRTMVNYCKFHTDKKNSTVILASIAAMETYGSVAYAESNSTLLIANSGSISPSDPVITISQNGYVTSVPMNGAIFTQGGIEWNPLTNTSVITQHNLNEGVLYPYEVAQYLPFVNEYPLICTISVESTSWSMVTSISDVSSLDPVNNVYAVLVNEAEGNEQQQRVSAIKAVNLDTCDQTWYKHPYGSEYFMSGPEFAYNQSALEMLQEQLRQQNAD